MDSYIYKRLWCAMKGYILWKTIEKKYTLTDKFIFFPEANNEYNYWGVKLLPEYMKKNHVQNITVLITKENMSAEFEENERIKKLYLQSTDMNNMLAFYALWDMSSKWTVVSTKNPYDTGAERLIGKKNVSIKDIVEYDVYQL